MKKLDVTKLSDEITKALEHKPAHIRKGQFVFNYMDCVYGVASIVQFEDKIDCFYNDDTIPEFLLACLKRINHNRTT